MPIYPEAWIVLTERPITPENHDRQHRLRSVLAGRTLNGRELEQWQYEVSSGARIWYCPDPDRAIVWIVHAGSGHLERTE